jgi:hypothetical protein
MKRWRNKILLLAGVAALGAAIPALGQDAPESLLPPGFGEPTTPLPPPEPKPAAPRPGAPAPAPGVAAAAPAPVAGEGEAPLSEEDVAAALEALNLPEPVEIPDSSRRGLDVVGVIGPGEWGLAPNGFGNADGRFLSTLMRRLDAPLPSRWTSILLRRALLSRVNTPRAVNPADWVAERAWLLLRMGEADGARMLVQSVDVDRFTPKMFSIGVQTALATADPAALCPLVGPGRETSDEPVWGLSDAICAALAGDAGRASALIDQARRRSRTGGIDLTLTEKVIGAGENTRRAVTVQWDNVDTLNSWRFGLAAATGLEIPDRLIGGVGPHVRAWQARAPMLPLEQRVEAAQIAASLGVFSSASLVEMYSLIADGTDPSEIQQTVGGRLREAYVAQGPAARVAAMRGLWDEAKNPVDRHARSILTASAASRIAPSEAFEADAPALIASMLTAGYDREAARWLTVVGRMSSGEPADRAWAMLAVASPDWRGNARSGFDAFRKSDASEEGYRSKLLLASLAGLGRIAPDEAASLAGDMDLRFDAQNSWTRLLESAVRSREPGTVILLAAIGMQTGGWRGVPPEHLYHILSALQRVGLGYEARMIAAEAMARA